MNKVIEPFEVKMNKSIASLEEEYASIRAGRANPHLLDKIKVDYYGTPSPIQSVANVSVPEARVIAIQPWESKMIKEIEKAIMASDLGITPGNDGKIIRLVFKKAGKTDDISEDETKKMETDVQKMTDKFIENIDKMVENKSKEIMTV